MVRYLYFSVSNTGLNNAKVTELRLKEEIQQSMLIFCFCKNYSKCNISVIIAYYLFGHDIKYFSLMQDNYLDF